MSDAYHYLDSDNFYLDTESGVLKNLLGIKDDKVLQFVESGAVIKRL